MAASNLHSPKRRRCEYKVLPPISTLYNCRHTSDIRLLLGDRTLYAHRLVLIAASPVFRAMLSGDWLESGSDCVRLDETADQSASGEEEECFPDMLRFMYTGSVVLDTTERLLELYRLSDKYGVSSLLQLCNSRIVELLRIGGLAGSESPLATQDEFTPGQLCRLACLPDSRVSQLARYNLLVAIGNDLRQGRIDSALLPLPADLHRLLECLLADDNLDAPEVDIFNGLCAWLLQQHHQQQQHLFSRSHVLSLLGCIRYPLMSPEQLYACECRLRDCLSVFCTTVVNAEKEEDVLRLLAPAYRHLALRNCVRSSQESSGGGVGGSGGRSFRRRHPFDILASTVKPLVVLLTPYKVMQQQQQSGASTAAATASSSSLASVDPPESV